MDRRLSSLLLILTLFSNTVAFNVDTIIPVIKKGPDGSYFGYSVAEHVVQDISTASPEQFLLLVGAPKFNTTGAIYKCQARTLGLSCELVPDLFTTVRKSDAQMQDIWMGSTISTSGAGKKVLICSHRFTVKYTGIGTCISVYEDLSPDDERRPCKSDGRENEGEAYCQAGTSGIMLEDDTIILGAPGTADWTGTLFKTNIGDSIDADRSWYHTPYVRNPVDTSTQESPVDLNSYMGMAVTSGRFDPGGVSYVGGAPRAGSTGQVVLFVADGSNRLTYKKDQILKGELPFSSFGYSLLAVDLNNDKFDELIVGSPMYLEKNTGGAIYIYTGGSRITSQSVPKKIMNQQKSEDDCMAVMCEDARFGYALGAAGDINRDNYNDFVVGAPYEGGNIGAVYIFHGSQNGVVTPYSQRIFGSEIDTGLRTFGFSLSAGMDMDRNGYPDILVGAYQSSNAVMLRTRPIMHLYTSIKVQPLKFNLEETPYCSYDDSSNRCIQLMLCARYEMYPAVSSYEVQYTVEADADQVAKRVEFAAGKIDQRYSLSGVVPLDNNKEKCDDFIVYLKPSIQDKLNPIVFNVNYSLPESATPTRSRRQAGLPDINRYPILLIEKQDQAQSTLTAVVEFRKNCGSDEICESDLELSADVELNKENNVQPILENIGSKDPISVLVGVENFGEPAYESTVFIVVPVAFEYVGAESIGADSTTPSCSVLNNVTLACNIGNPFLRNNKREFRVVFDPSALDPSTAEFKIVVFVNTTSREKTPLRDTKDILIKVITKADIILSGTAQPDKDLIYGGKVLGESEIKYDHQIGPQLNHTYRIYNSGPGAIGEGTLIIDWPFELASEAPGTHGKHLLYPMRPPTYTRLTDLSTGEIDCRESGIEMFNPLDIKRGEVTPKESVTVYGDRTRRRREAEESSSVTPYVEGEDSNVRTGSQRGQGMKNVIELNCQNGRARCREIKCKIRNFASKTIMDLKIEARLWQYTLIENFMDADLVKIVSNGRIVLNPALNIKQDTSDDTATAETYAVPEVEAPGIKSVSWWIILVAVLGGILLLVILILLFWKCGFFKRKKLQDQDLTFKAEVKKNIVDENGEPAEKAPMI